MVTVTLEDNSNRGMLLLREHYEWLGAASGDEIAWEYLRRYEEYSTDVLELVRMSVEYYPYYGGKEKPVEYRVPSQLVINFSYPGIRMVYPAHVYKKYMETCKKYYVAHEGGLPVSTCDRPPAFIYPKAYMLQFYERWDPLGHFEFCDFLLGGLGERISKAAPSIFKKFKEKGMETNPRLKEIDHITFLLALDAEKDGASVGAIAGIIYPGHDGDVNRKARKAIERGKYLRDQFGYIEIALAGIKKLQKHERVWRKTMLGLYSDRVTNVKEM